MNIDALPSAVEADPPLAPEIDRLRSQLAARERQIASLESEIAHVRRQSEDGRLEAEQLRRGLEVARDAARNELSEAREALRRLELQVQQANADLHTIHSSRSWRFIQFIRRLRQHLFPRGGRREWFAKKIFGFTRRLWRTFRLRQVAHASRNLQQPVSPGQTQSGTGDEPGSGSARSLSASVPKEAAAKLATLKEIAAAACGTVIFPPSVGWSIDLFQRPHHLARVMARDGYAVVFDCSTSFDDVDVLKEIEPRLFLFRGEPEWLADLPRLTLWTFSYNYDHRNRYPGSARVIYDWIDDLAVFPRDQRMLRQLHLRAMKEADVVAAVARKLFDEARRERPDALFLPNAVEGGRFEAEPLPNPARNDRELAPVLASGRPIAGYYGALAKWFDYPLLIAAARLRPDWNFVLIGPDYDQSVVRARFSKHQNITWIGQRKYHELPGYLHLFTVATVPFRINDITMATSPLKLYEYFAAGKPVVATPMPECMAYPEVHIADSAAAFSAALDAARRQATDPEFVQRQRQIADENTWHARVRRAFAVLDAIGAAGDEHRSTSRRLDSTVRAA